jgi:hypothetical protein
MRTLGAFLGLSLLFSARAAMATPFTVYDDALSSSFSDKSVQVTPNYSSTSNVYSGTDCISLLLYQGSEMIVASSGTPDISQYGGVDFYHRTSAGTLTLVVQLRDSTQLIGNAVKVSVTTTWTNAHLTLADFGLNQNSGTIVGIDFTTSSLNVPGMALDEITLFDAPIVDGGTDAAIIDGGAPDVTIIDGGPIDSGTIESGTTDGGPIDASPADSGPSEGGATDASEPPDASADAGGSEASTPDASKKDAAPTPEGGVDEAGPGPGEGTSGCSCDLATTNGYTWAIPLALVALALIARRRRS